MRVKYIFAAVILVAAGACDVRPLRTEDLFSAAPSRADAGTDVLPGSAPDAQVVACEPTSRTGILSGSVVDKCTGQSIAALVGIFGRHQCSFAGKGSYCFGDLPVGCALTLTSDKAGYKHYFKALKIDPGGTAAITIELEPESGDCTPAPPPPGTCTCALLTCVNGCL